MTTPQYPTTAHLLMDYEISSSRLLPLFKWQWTRGLASTYFSRKVERKITRWGAAREARTHTTEDQ